MVDLCYIHRVLWLLCYIYRVLWLVCYIYRVSLLACYGWGVLVGVECLGRYGRGVIMVGVFLLALVVGLSFYSMI